MDTSKTYQEIVKSVISNYAKLRPSHGNIRLDIVFDETLDRYALMQVGWDRGQRIRGNLIYVIIENNKILIEYDGLECGISQDLIQQGIPEYDIIFNFLPKPQATSIHAPTRQNIPSREISTSSPVL
jgi:hypothetical protein